MALPRMPTASNLVSKPVKILFGTVWIVFYPLICVLHEVHIRAHERRDGYIRTDPKPRSINPIFRRRRTLSIDPRKQKFHAKRCMILALPREVRDMIWKEAMGGMVIHLWISRGKFRGGIIHSNDVERDVNCRRGNPQCEPSCSILGILQSCKQVYAEVISLVYSQNRFSTNCVETIAYLPRVMLPQRINTIQSLFLSWKVIAPPSFPHVKRCAWNDQTHRMEKAKQKNHYFRQIWVRTWKSLAAMEGLITLKVELNTRSGGPHSPLSNSHHWGTNELEIVKSVTRPKTFQLALHSELAQRAKRDISSPNLKIIEISLDEYY